MLKYSEYKKVMELKMVGVNQHNIIKKTGFTQYAVRKVWDMTESEFLSSGKFTHEQMDEFKEDVMSFLTTPYNSQHDNT